jgi:alpha-amylase
MSSFGAAAVSDARTSDDDTQLGSGAIYQFYHTPWDTIRDSLPTIGAAGYDAIQVPPAQRSKRTWADPEPRGYQPIDHLDFTSVFGTESAFRAMIASAHDQGLDVIADAVMNHMAEGVDFDGFPHFDWDHFRHAGPIKDDEDDWELENRDLEGLPDLRQESQHVRDHLEAYVQKYADCGVDGLRWDAVKHMPVWFFRDHANPWAQRRGLYTIGEVLHGSVSYCERYLDTGMAVMDYPLYFTMREEAFGSNGDLRTLDGAGVVAQHPRQTVTFVSNHDSPPPELERLAYAYILTYEGYSRVYSGRIDSDDEGIATLLSIRRTHAAGPAVTRHASRDCYVFERKGNLLVGLNRTSEWRTVAVHTSWKSQSLSDHSGHAQPVTTDSRGQVDLAIPPTGWVCYAP